MKKQKLALIVPCYNESDRLNVAEFEKYALSRPEIQIIFANDGSSDNTAEILKSMASQTHNISMVDNTINKGKAETIRQVALSLDSTHFEYVAFWDADLATPLNEVSLFLNTFDIKPNLLCVMGARILRLGAPIKRKPARHYLGRVFATIVSMMLKLPVYDTQCGAKIFRADICQTIFKDSFVSKWFFDVELLFRMKSSYKVDNNNPQIYELPLHSWEDVAGSKLKLTDFLTAPLELLKIYKRYYS